jgi:hypothetical protein
MLDCYNAHHRPAASGGSIMPVHEWPRVSAGTFHAFHCSWIVEIQNVLNNGVLPADYYAQAEQIIGDLGVLTLQTNGLSGEQPLDGSPGAVAVALAPPKVRFTATIEMDQFSLKQRALVIRHSSDDRIVALIEILSPGNKSSRHALGSFVDKAVSALTRGYHLLLVDVHPPTKRDPDGIDGAILAEIGDDTYTAPPDKPLTLATYSAGSVIRAFVEPVAVGDVLPDMALFLDPESYVLVPLEATYVAAYRGVPRRWRTVLEGPHP